MTKCHAKRCEQVPPDGKPFCARHWASVPQRLKSEWYHRDKTVDPTLLLDRIADGIERAEFGERLL